MMKWRTPLKALQSLLAYTLLFCFTLLLVLKLDHVISYSWWLIFLPLFTFHGVVTREKFSLLVPAVPHYHDWAPWHSEVVTPLLVSFELLLCVYLESLYVYGDAAINYKIVFCPIIAFAVIILIDNVRVLLAQEDSRSYRKDLFRDFIPLMSFSVIATILCFVIFSDDLDADGWWELSVCLSCLGSSFLICTKWSNPIFHKNPQTSPFVLSPATALLILSSEEYWHERRMCDLRDIITKVALSGFQVLLFMHIQGIPAVARDMPLLVVFAPILLIQGAGMFFPASALVEKLRKEAATRGHVRFSSWARDLFGFLHRGSRLLGCWSGDEGSQDEEVQLYQEWVSGRNTFYSHPPDILKKTTKRDLAKEVWRLHAALGDQIKISKYIHREFEKLQNEKLLCRVCFEGEISVVLLPCRHRVLCGICSQKCKKCPICRSLIKKRLHVYDA